MHSVLLVIDTPNAPDQQQRTAWQNLRGRIENIAAHEKGVQILGQNIALILLEHGLSALTQLVAAADQERFAHRALFFEREPEWVMSS